MGLAQLAPSLVGSQIAGLSALGAQQQGQTQAGLTAQQQLAQAQALEEQQRLSQLGAGITSLIAGYPAQTQTQDDSFTKWISNWIRYSINTSRYLQIV
jgi:hypothetical protein